VKSFDLDVALANTDDDPEFFRDIVATFERTHGKLLSEVERNLEDAPGLERAAHTLKGALQAFSARPAVQVAYSLEQRGRSSQLDGCADSFLELKALVEELRIELHQAVEGLLA